MRALDQEDWQEFRLQADERPKTFYVYWVTGHGQFPYDMLRHDLCWPATGEDASKIEYRPGVSSRAPRSIKMHSYRPPTVQRWTSFLWSVGNLQGSLT